MPLRTWSVLAFSLLLPALASASDVKTDFDPEVDFTRFRTFSFVGGKEMTKTGLLAKPETRERIKNFISGVMESRGLREVPIDSPYDIAVRYWVARKAKTDTQMVLDPDPMWAGYPAYYTGTWGLYYTEYVVTNYVEGTLVVDLLNPANKELLWRTYLRQKIEDRAKAYDEAKKNLTKSFKLYPPGDKEKKQMREDRAKLEKKYAK